MFLKNIEGQVVFVEISCNTRRLQLSCQRQLLEPLTGFSMRHQHTIIRKKLEKSVTGEHSDERKIFRKRKQRLELKARTNRKRFLVQLLYDSLQASLRYIEVDI